VDSSSSPDELDTRRQPVRPDLLSQQLRGLVGQECWEAQERYPGDFVLELGERRPMFSATVIRRVADLVRSKKGEWRIFTSVSDWSLVENSVRIARYGSSERRLNAARSALSGKKVKSISVRPEDLGLAVTFPPDTILYIVPRPDTDLSSWEVARPDGSVLVVGPGRTWTVRKPRS
jgi:hypothetical protein